MIRVFINCNYSVVRSPIIKMTTKFKYMLKELCRFIWNILSTVLSIGFFLFFDNDLNTLHWTYATFWSYTTLFLYIYINWLHNKIYWRCIKILLIKLTIFRIGDIRISKQKGDIFLYKIKVHVRSTMWGSDPERIIVDGYRTMNTKPSRYIKARLKILLNSSTCLKDS